jgi:hypothetical protein
VKRSDRRFPSAFQSWRYSISFNSRRVFYLLSHSQITKVWNPLEFQSPFKNNVGSA